MCSTKGFVDIDKLSTDPLLHIKINTVLLVHGTHVLICFGLEDALLLMLLFVRHRVLDLLLQEFIVLKDNNERDILIDDRVMHVKL